MRPTGQRKKAAINTNPITFSGGDRRRDEQGSGPQGSIERSGPMQRSGPMHKRWKTAGDRSRWLRERLREGYALLELATLDEACDVWLEVWREVLAVAADVPLKTLADVMAVLGLPRAIASWADDFCEAARWLDPTDAPTTTRAVSKLLDDLARRFPHENIERIVCWGCTRADLVRAVNGDTAGEKAYKHVATVHCDRAQVVKRWIDSRLDVRTKPITLGELRASAALLNIAMRRDYVDLDHHPLRCEYEALRADIERCEFLGTTDGPIAWPYWEVFSWPAAQLLWHLDPYLGDAFDAKYGEFLFDVEPPPSEDGYC